MNKGKSIKPYRALTPSEEKELAVYEKKAATLRDKTRQVVKGTKLALICWGEGGIGKSYNILKTFEESGLKKDTDYILTNSRLSTPALENLIKAHPTLVHFMEDIESLFEQRSALGYLRSLLWGQKDEQGVMRRYATPTVVGKDKRVEFTGKLVVTANCPLDDLPELRALGTRTIPFRLQATNPQLLAKMKEICNRGYTYKGVALTPEQCFQVYDFYFNNVPLKRLYDLRVLEHGFWDMIDGINGVLKETTWEEIYLTEILKGEEPPVTRKTRIRAMREIALRLHALFEEGKISGAEMHQRWDEETGGASLASMYRRLRGE
jgi:hypothetical protein